MHKCTYIYIPTCIYACMLSCFIHVQLFATLWNVACQAPLSMGFPRQEDWSELPFPPPGESSPRRDQAHISRGSCIAGRFLTGEPPGKPYMCVCVCYIQAHIYTNA